VSHANTWFHDEDKAIYFKEVEKKWATNQPTEKVEEKSTPQTNSNGKLTRRERRYIAKHGSLTGFVPPMNPGYKVPDGSQSLVKTEKLDCSPPGSREDLITRREPLTPSELKLWSEEQAKADERMEQNDDTALEEWEAKATPSAQDLEEIELEANLEDLEAEVWSLEEDWDWAVVGHKDGTFTADEHREEQRRITECALGIVSDLRKIGDSELKVAPRLQSLLKALGIELTIFRKLSGTDSAPKEEVTFQALDDLIEELNGTSGVDTPVDGNPYNAVTDAHDAFYDSDYCA
jgi:hypothetical protein